MLCPSCDFYFGILRSGLPQEEGAGEYLVRITFPTHGMDGMMATLGLKSSGVARNATGCGIP